MEEILQRIEAKLDLLIGKKNASKIKFISTDTTVKVAQYIEENCVQHENLFIEARQLSNRAQLSQKAISGYLKSIKIDPARKFINGKQIRIWQGIGWKTEDI